jgi:hypothetical protein
LGHKVDKYDNDKYINSCTNLFVSSVIGATATVAKTKRFSVMCADFTETQKLE